MVLENSTQFKINSNEHAYNTTGGVDEVMEGRLSSCDRGCGGTSERGWEPPRDADSLTLYHGLRYPGGCQVQQISPDQSLPISCPTETLNDTINSIVYLESGAGAG